MAETRIRIDKQIWKSVTPGSVVVTDSNNEQQYVVPGSNGQVLQVVAGVPAWVTPAAGFSGFSITDGTTTEAIASADTITVAGSDKVTAVVSATDTITVGLDTTGASTNDVLTIDGSGNVIWAPNAFDNEFTSVATLPATGETDLIYHNQADNKFYIWDGAAFVEVPTAASFSLSMSDGTTTETLANGNTINFASSDKVTAVVSATDTVTVGLDTTGATAGQQLTFDGTNVVWGSAYTPLAANGLNVEAGVVEMGGALNEDTTITLTPGTGDFLRIDNNQTADNYAEFQVGGNENTLLYIQEAGATLQTLLGASTLQLSDTSGPLSGVYSPVGASFSGPELIASISSDELVTDTVAGQNSTVIGVDRLSGTDPIGIVLKGGATVDANLHLIDIDLTGTAVSALGITADGKVVSYSASAPIAVPANEDYIDTNLSGSVLTVTGSLTNFYYTVFRNGLRQKLGLDYTVSGQNITFTDAPISGETFAVEFRGKNTL